MPHIRDLLARGAGLLVEETEIMSPRGNPTINPPTLVERVYIPIHNSSVAPVELIYAHNHDPWQQSGKYANAWTWFAVCIFAFAFFLRLHHIWTDKMRTAWFKERMEQQSGDYFSQQREQQYEMAQLDTDRSTNKLFPRLCPEVEETPDESKVSSFSPINAAVAGFRYIFYRPLRPFTIKKGWRAIAPPSLGVLAIMSIALGLTILYTFVPKPLYRPNIEFGSPPLAIRAGMMAVSMVPWLIALSMKANLISFLTGIGHERLNVLHRWGGWLCLLLALIHTIPFYIQPIWESHRSRFVYRAIFNMTAYPYGTGVAALVPLAFLCLHSLAPLRHWMYELFVAVHVPVAFVFIGTLMWHCNNYLNSWAFIYASIAIWATSYFARFFFFLNWTEWWRMAWLIGDEASVVIMAEDTIKVTIPTQKKWKPGQYVYLRMPGISIFENHPFTIASLWSEDFPSDYGEEFRDMILVFRPFGGFTRKVLEKAIVKGPLHSYRAFIDGPYGGMTRSLESFDDVVLVAGGSGVTALVSHLLNLIKRMRDGKAVTKRVRIIWALKRPEILDWFREELKICRENAPPDAVSCQFYVTAAKRVPEGGLVSVATPARPVSTFFHDKINGAFQDLADKRQSHYSEYSRHSALIRDEAAGDPEREKELRQEREDAITALPQAHLAPARNAQSEGDRDRDGAGDGDAEKRFPFRSIQDKRRVRNSLRLDTSNTNYTVGPDGTITTEPRQRPDSFNFGFPTTPSEFQKNLMRFAFLPAAIKKTDGWSTEYGRPDLPYMLRKYAKDFGPRSCVFVCGPPSMRLDVSRTVAELQTTVLSIKGRQEIFLHTENYAI